MKVSLSILTADFSNFEKSVGNVMKESDYIHIYNLYNILDFH